MPAWHGSDIAGIEHLVETAFRRDVHLPAYDRIDGVNRAFAPVKSAVAWESHQMERDGGHDTLRNFHDLELVPRPERLGGGNAHRGRPARGHRLDVAARMRLEEHCLAELDERKVAEI